MQLSSTSLESHDPQPQSPYLKRLIISIFRITLALAVIGVLLSGFLYGEYWYLRRANPTLQVPEPTNQLVQYLDNRLGLDWNNYLSQDGHLPTQKDSVLQKPTQPAPELTGITHWYQRNPSTLPNYQNGAPAHFDTPHTLAEFRGSPVLLAFGRLACSQCLNIYTYLQEFYLHYGSTLTIIALQSPKYESEKDWDNIVSELDERSILFPVALDVDQTTSQEYGVDLVPTIFLIDQDGYLVYRNIGLGDIQEVRQAIEEVVGY